MVTVPSKKLDLSQLFEMMSVAYQQEETGRKKIKINRAIFFKSSGSTPDLLKNRALFVFVFF